MRQLSQFYIHEQKLPGRPLEWVIKAKNGLIDEPHWTDAVVFVGRPFQAVKYLDELQGKERLGESFVTRTKTVVERFSGKKIIYLDEEK